MGVLVHVNKIFFYTGKIKNSAFMKNHDVQAGWRRSPEDMKRFIDKF